MPATLRRAQGLELVERLGTKIAGTCDVCGLSKTQFRIWRRHYPEFAAMVRHGQAEAVKTHLSIIREAAGKRWQA